jgi:hypothetical protein
VAIAAMALLFRYKAAIEESAERHDEDANHLFISAYMVASTEVCGASYQVEFWMNLTNNRFRGRELENMEDNFCDALHGEVQVDGGSFAWFKAEIDEYTRERRASGNESDHDDDGEDDLSPPPAYEAVVQVRGRGAVSLLGSPFASEFHESDEDVEALARIFRDSTITSGDDDTENILISKGKKLISTCKKKISQIVSLNISF